MSGLFDKPKNNIYGDSESKVDPFESKVENTISVVSPAITRKTINKIKSTVNDILNVPEGNQEEGYTHEIKENIPFLEMVDDLPGVADIMPGDMEREDTLKALTLKGANEDVKEFTNEIKARRIHEEENNVMHPHIFHYDVEKVRIFGQYGASVAEMAAYFEVDKNTVSKLLTDENSDFYKVYNKARAILGLSLRQVQIKAAMGGSEKMMIHLGKHLLDQTDNAVEAPRETELSRDGKKRRTRITILSKQIEEFDD